MARETTATTASSAAGSVAQASSQPARKAIVFDPSETVIKYIGDNIHAQITMQAHVMLVQRRSEELLHLHLHRKADPAKLLAEGPLQLAVGKEYLEAYKPVHDDASLVAMHIWLIGMTLGTKGETLKKFFDLALAFKEKNFDLPSLIVNEAIRLGKTEFLRELRAVYPDTNLAELYPSWKL